jgi:hypothetical protein
MCSNCHTLLAFTSGLDLGHTEGPKWLQIRQQEKKSALQQTVYFQAIRSRAMKEKNTPEVPNSGAFSFVSFREFQESRNQFQNSYFSAFNCLEKGQPIAVFFPIALR